MRYITEVPAPGESASRSVSRMALSGSSGRFGGGGIIRGGGKGGVSEKKTEDHG